jgi:hypothetical protein
VKDNDKDKAIYVEPKIVSLDFFNRRKVK